jgi:hypothetical protein
MELVVFGELIVRDAGAILVLIRKLATVLRETRLADTLKSGVVDTD